MDLGNDRCATRVCLKSYKLAEKNFATRLFFHHSSFENVCSIDCAPTHLLLWAVSGSMHNASPALLQSSVGPEARVL